MIPRPEVVWRKSSRSNGSGGGECVELWVGPGDGAVRDSKNEGVILTSAGKTLGLFLQAVKGGQFDN